MAATDPFPDASAADPGRADRRFWAGMVGVLAAALLVRCVFFVGLIGSDDLSYIEHAHALAVGRYVLTAHEFALRFGLISPMAAAELALGPGMTAYALPTLAASLASIVLAGLIGRRLGGRGAGWLAAALTAFLPLNAYGATELHADLPMGAWLLGALWLLLRRGILDGPPALVPGAPAGSPAAESAEAARTRETGDRRAAWAAGLLIGVAYLTKLSAFLAVPVFCLLAPGRPRLRRVLLPLAGGAVAVFAAETLFYAAATGDPGFHLNAVRGGHHRADMERVFPDAPAVLYRLFADLPRTLFDPTSGNFPATGGVFLLLAAFLALRGRGGAAGIGLLMRWILAWLILLDFWPVRLWPYLPGQNLAPRVLEPALTPAAIALALMGARAFGDPRRWVRGAVAGILVLSVAGNLVVLSVLRQDARRWRSTTEAAHAFLARQPAEMPVLSDERTVALLRVMDGFRDEDRYRDFSGATPSSARGVFVVVNRLWLNFLRREYGKPPPAEALDPPPTWLPVYTCDPPVRRSLRGALLGRPGPGDSSAANRLTIYWAPGE